MVKRFTLPAIGVMARVVLTFIKRRCWRMAPGGRLLTSDLKVTQRRTRVVLSSRPINSHYLGPLMVTIRQEDGLVLCRGLLATSGASWGSDGNLCIRPLKSPAVPGSVREHAP